MDIQTLENKYSHSSYNDVLCHPLDEVYVTNKIFFHIGTCHPAQGRSYSVCFDLEKREKVICYHEKNSVCTINGVRISWITKRPIPEKVLAKFPVFQIRKSQAWSYATNPHSDLVCLHKWNEYWYLMRYPEGFYRNIYSGDLIPVAQQINMEF